MEPRLNGAIFADR